MQLLPTQTKHFQKVYKNIRVREIHFITRRTVDRKTYINRAVTVK